MTLPQQMYTDLQAQIPALKKALSKGATYATELGQRIINYDITINVFYLIVWLGVMIIFLKCAKSFWNNFTKQIETDEEKYILPAVVFGIISLVLLIIVPISFFEGKMLENIFKAVFVPEWRLIEILSSIL